jgi:hypothetical protein
VNSLFYFPLIVIVLVCSNGSDAMVMALENKPLTWRIKLVSCTSKAWLDSSQTVPALFTNVYASGWYEGACNYLSV